MEVGEDAVDDTHCCVQASAAAARMKSDHGEEIGGRIDVERGLALPALKQMALALPRYLRHVGLAQRVVAREGLEA